MAAEFLMQFPRQAFSVGQQLAFAFPEKKMLLLTCKELEGRGTLIISNAPYVYSLQIDWLILLNNMIYFSIYVHLKHYRSVYVSMRYLNRCLKKWYFKTSLRFWRTENTEILKTIQQRMDHFPV